MTQIGQQQQQPTASTPATASIVRITAVFILVFGATALLVRCVAVATQSPHGHASSSGQIPGIRAGSPLSVEQLGAKAGCKPKVQTNAAELRQGYCTTPSGRFFMTTFTTSQGQRAYLELAQSYGALLIGNRWIVGASPQLLQQLRGKLGGEIYNVAKHDH
ncbi:MAG TPA: hypothetical protein VH912_33365 [Streptosporangiaceae bacterium]|jgi:hypothetical protein